MVMNKHNFFRNLWLIFVCIINVFHFQNLLALRDHKAQSRINKHLKVCKAANKSVLIDAIDNDNTAVTMAGMNTII